MYSTPLQLYLNFILRTPSSELQQIIFFHLTLYLASFSVISTLGYTSVMKFNKSRHTSSPSEDHLSAADCIPTSDIELDLHALVQPKRLDFSH